MIGEIMVLSHVALVCSSEENSDRFYQDVLGLEKLNSKLLSAELSKKIFQLDDEYQIINYGDEFIRFEIFISTHSHIPQPRLDHVCLAVGDRDRFINRCTEMNVHINKIPKGDALLVFVEDYDGNLFEIKEKE